jgi:hypothetical protein
MIRDITMHPSQPMLHLHRTLLVAVTLQLSLLLPTLMRLIARYHLKEPYHTSILSGYAWVQELLHGHPERIHTELGVHKEVFHALITELKLMGHGDTNYVTLEEQLAIFLYTAVTGLSIRHVGERFQ